MGTKAFGAGMGVIRWYCVLVLVLSESGDLRGDKCGDIRTGSPILMLRISRN